jgi:hypothetical protein
MEGNNNVCGVSGHLPWTQILTIWKRVFCRGEGKGEAFEHAQNMLYNSSCMVLGFRGFSM